LRIWDGSSTQLRAEITHDLRATSGKYDLTVVNPDGQSSNTYTLLMSPVIGTVTPSAALAGSSGVNITVTGIGFIAADVVGLPLSGQQRTALTTTWVNSAKLIATIPASALVNPAAATIEVFDPPYGEKSLQLPFAILATPVIASVSPSSINAG